MSALFKEVQEEVLKAFEEEIPSIYYSDKSQEEYKVWKRTMSRMYHDLMKFPPEMFKDKTLLDFGGGTGENTVYLTEWGAKCTLVEINPKAHEISKEIFKKYSKNFELHKFVNQSLFDFKTDEKFDIVHSRGVFAHTNDPEEAFNKLSGNLKEGGYLIYGDGNKSGNFQNMLQRMIIYRFSSTWDEMVEVAEMLFKEDLDRAQKYANRSRRCIIFDKWVVPRLTNPSLTEVLTWFENNNIKLYSSYPNFIPAIQSDSFHHKPEFSMEKIKHSGALIESFWMIYNKEDAIEIKETIEIMKPLNEAQHALVSQIDDFGKDTKFNVNTFLTDLNKYANCLAEINLTKRLVERTNVFVREVEKVVEFMASDNLNGIKREIQSAKELFRGGNGVRHIDFIGFKEKRNF